MAIKLQLTQADFSQKLSHLLRARGESHADVGATVNSIISEVKKNGDGALREYTKKFDRFEPSAFRLSKSAIQKTANNCTAEIKHALKVAAARIAAYSKKQLPQDYLYEDEIGARLGWRWNAVKSAGLYVPGGLATYPSSVLMNAIPAKVAGVKRLVVTVPAPEGALNPAVMAACEIAGVDEIYTIGGAQAIAALAFGTESILPVDVIVGPGNAYVAEAKRQLFGKVGIDMIAGPSEVLVVADSSMDAKWIAMDLLSQAEHDEKAQSILITDSDSYADQVMREVVAALEILPRAAIAKSSWESFGAIIVVNNLQQDAPELIDLIAPEHLQLACSNAETLAEKITNAGAIFIGNMTPEAIGDYIAGPSHVLPTSGTARFASGLSVFDFLKRTSIIQCPNHAFDALAKDAITLAESEGLDAHLGSMQLRTERKN